MRWLPAILIACSSGALAQDNEQPAPVGSPADVVNEVGPGTLDSSLSLLSGIEINAGEEGSNAAIRLGSTLSSTGGRFHTLNVTASAALDKDTGIAFSSLDPFANGVSIEGRYTFTQIFGRADPGRVAFDFCEEVARQSGVAMGDAGCSDSYIRANAPSRFNEFQRLFYPNPTVIFGGVFGRVGREGFKFLDAASGNPVEESREPWSIGGFLGVSHLPWRNSFAIDFRHQTRFKAAQTAAVCPGSAAGVVVCPVGPVGPPTEREQDVIGVEYRQRIGRSFAFSIRGSYDFDGEIWQLDLPAYFISDNNLGVNAGVRARYVRDPDPDDLNEGWVFGVFVSKSFSLFQ